MSEVQSVRLPEPPRARRVRHLLIVLWLLSVADLLFTMWAHFFTPFFELNPIARSLLSYNLLPSLVLYKLVVTGIGTAIFWRLRHHRQAELALWGLVLVYVMLAMRWSNYTVDAATAVASAA